MMYVTIGVIILLILLSITAIALGEALSELPSFMYVTLGAIVLLIGAALYLSFAVPSWARTSPDGSSSNQQKNSDVSVTQDQMQGMELLEEE
jgi:hypothetical protein